MIATITRGQNLAPPYCMRLNPVASNMPIHFTPRTDTRNIKTEIRIGGFCQVSGRLGVVSRLHMKLTLCGLSLDHELLAILYGNFGLESPFPLCPGQ